MPQFKSQAPKDALHPGVRRQEVRDHSIVPLDARDLHKSPDQLRAQSALLKGVAHYDRQFDLVFSMNFDQTPNADDLTLARGWVVSLSDQRWSGDLWRSRASRGTIE